MISQFRRKMMGKFPSRLPEEYQEVRWLKSTGYQYINTGILPTRLSSAKLTEMKFEPTDTGTNKFFGAYDGSTQFALSMYADPNQNYVASCHGWTSFLNPLATMQVASFDYTTNSFHSSVHGDVIGSAAYARPTAGSLPIIMFGWNERGSITKGRCKFWYWFAKDMNNDYIFYFVPCYLKSDATKHTAGMFELVSRQFFPNAGSEYFEVGPKVN